MSPAKLCDMMPLCASDSCLYRIHFGWFDAAAIAISVRRLKGLSIVTSSGDTHQQLLANREEEVFEKLLELASAPGQRTAAGVTTGNFLGPQIEKIKVEELANDFLRDYRINGRKSLRDVKTRWSLHLSPFFSGLRTVDVTSDMLSRFVDSRQQEGATNATINENWQLPSRMFRLGQQATPPKILRLPHFPHLQENNVRKGFLEDSQFRRLVEGSELWFRTLVECGRTYGWRVSELLNMRVAQIDLAQRTIRLEPGTTKNTDGREVVMTAAVRVLVSACISEKSVSEYVFTRPNGKRVSDFRVTWERACSRIGAGTTTCVLCSEVMDAGRKCRKCESKRWTYAGLIFHDLRRTGARNLRRAGISETVIMRIGGWRTRSVFERYAIVNRNDMADAILKLEQKEKQIQHGHDLVTLGRQTPTGATSNVGAQAHLSTIASAN
jgi:integrase